MPVNATKLKVLASTLDIVVNHIDKDSAAEHALFLEDLVDQIKLVPNGLLLFLCELRLHRTFTTDTDGLTTFDLEGGKDVFEA